MEFKRVLDDCKKQVEGNQNLINYLLTNLPRIKEILSNKSNYYVKLDNFNMNKSDFFPIINQAYYNYHY